MTTPLDLVFMGTPDFAAKVLGGLIGAGHRVRAVYTQPPRPAGRGHRLQPSPIQALAEQRGIEVRCPTSLRAPEAQAEFAATSAEAAVVAAYGLILPAPILNAPRLGCLNVHASLLPRWRGAAPIQRAILAGDAETGVAIMQMDKSLDTGDVLLEQKTAIGTEDTAQTLHDRLATLGAQALLQVLDALPGVHPRKQDAAGVTYAQKLTKEEARLDWSSTAMQLSRAV